MIEPTKQLGKKFYKLLSADAIMQEFVNDEMYAGIWFWDLNQRNHIWLSQSFNKLLGFEKDSQLQSPHSWNELVPKDYIDSISILFDEYLAGDQSEQLQIEIPFLDRNKRIVFLNSKSIVINDNAYLLGLVKKQETNKEVRASTITTFPFNQGNSELIKGTTLQVNNLEIKISHLNSEYESKIKAEKNGGWEYKVDTGDLWCNKEYFDLLGYDFDSIMGWGKYDFQKVWTDLLHPEDAENVTNNFLLYLNDLKEIYQNDFRMKHANGSWIWVSSIGKLMIKDINGVNTLLIVGTNTDITKRKKIESELSEANALLVKNNTLLKSIIDSSEEMFILSIDTDYRFTSFPNRYQKFAYENFGKDICIGYNILDLFSDSQMAVFKPAIDAALRGEHKEINSIISMNSNKLTSVHSNYNPIINNEGEIIGATIFIHDLTKKNYAEIESKIDELGYATLFSEANEAIIIANVKTGFIVDANLKALELMGYSKSELLTMHQSQLHPPEFINENGNRFKEFTSSNDSKSLESIVLTKSGEKVPVQISTGSLFKLEGEHFCAAYFKDITSKKLIKEELDKKKRQLNEIAWIQSHMVKTPLARLMGFSNALERGIVSEIDKPVYLKYIKDSANELDCVIREIKAKAIVN